MIEMCPTDESPGGMKALCRKGLACRQAFDHPAVGIRYRRPALLAIVYAIARVVDFERAEDLTMDAVMWTWAGLLMLAPIGLAIYAVFRLTKRLAGRKLS
jgi:hypothetical protein